MLPTFFGVGFYFVPSVMPPPRPSPIRVLFFVDCQNLKSKCERVLSRSWAHPARLAEALLEEDEAKYGKGSRRLVGVRYYTGIHDLGREPAKHSAMARRLHAYQRDGVQLFVFPLKYAGDGSYSADVSADSGS